MSTICRHTRKNMPKSELKEKAGGGGEMAEAVGNLNVDPARKEVGPFVKNPEAVTVWSKAFFKEAVRRIVLV
jgi:hypothetical protein